MAAAGHPNAGIKIDFKIIIKIHKIFLLFLLRIIGYDKIVTRFNLALNNPSGFKTVPNVNKQELQEIRAKANSIWSAKDTYGKYLLDSNKNDYKLFLIF